MVKLTIIAFSSSGEAGVQDWLRSIKSQRYRFWEAILIESHGDIGRISTWYGDTGKRHVKDVKPPSSHNDALNMGLARASGDVICLLRVNCAFKTADVMGRVAGIMEDPEVDLVFGNIEVNKIVDGTGQKRLAHTSNHQPPLHARERIPQPDCLFVRADWWHYFGGLETCYRRGSEFARVLDLLSQPGIEARYLDEVLVTRHQVEPRRESRYLFKSLGEIRIASAKGRFWSYMKSRWRARAIPSHPGGFRSEFPWSS